MKAPLLSLVPRSIWLHGALAALLLFVQLGALTHALSHASRQTHGGDAQIHSFAYQQVQGVADADDVPGGQASPWCAFDLTYNQVLGGVASTAALPVVVAVGTEHVGRRAHLRIAADPPPFYAQGPPVFL